MIVNIEFVTSVVILGFVITHKSNIHVLYKLINMYKNQHKKLLRSNG
jgi:hypothetical protein